MLPYLYIGDCVGRVVLMIGKHKKAFLGRICQLSDHQRHYIIIGYLVWLRKQRTEAPTVLCLNCRPSVFIYFHASILWNRADSLPWVLLLFVVNDIRYLTPGILTGILPFTLQEDLIKKILSRPFKIPIPNYSGPVFSKALGVRRQGCKRALHDPEKEGALILYHPKEIGAHEQLKIR